LHDLDPVPMIKQPDGSFSTIPETGSAFDLAEKIKNQPTGKADPGQVVDAAFEFDAEVSPGQEPGTERTLDPENDENPKQPYDEKADTVDTQDPPPGTEKKEDEKKHEGLKDAMKEQSDKMIHGILPSVAKTFAELTNNGDAGVFWRMREKGLDLFFDTFEDKMSTWPKEIQIFVRSKCKNIAGKHPEFVERFEKAIAIAVVPPPEDVLTVYDEDDIEAWNGLYYDCPNMDGNPIAKALCKRCKEREGCPTPFVPESAKQQDMF